jgi:hypothetical protein
LLLSKKGELALPFLNSKSEILNSKQISNPKFQSLRNC